MARHNDLGHFGEQAAVDLLTAKGYAIVDRNWRCGRMEIDIVAQRGSRLAIVEVKTRSAGALYPAAYAVTTAKRRRILLTARRYLAESGCDLQPRCDVALVTAERGRVLHFTYLENAF